MNECMNADNEWMNEWMQAMTAWMGAYYSWLEKSFLFQTVWKTFLLSITLLPRKKFLANIFQVILRPDGAFKSVREKTSVLWRKYPPPSIPIFFCIWSFHWSGQIKIYMPLYIRIMVPLQKLNQSMELLKISRRKKQKRRASFGLFWWLVLNWH